MSTDLFDYAEALRRRDEAMVRVGVHSGDFKYRYFHFVNNLPRGWVGTNEDIRKAWPYAQPHHPNAWGSCWGGAVKRGILVELEDQVRMSAKKSHSRKTHLYRKV